MALRIKQNVDLKELEKYGFKIERKTHIPIYKTCERQSYIEELFVCGQSGRDIGYGIKGKNFGYGMWNFDILYDLIKDDLVEKVKE